METGSALFDGYVERGILAANPFGIREVRALAPLYSGYLHREEYPMIERLVAAADLEGIAALKMNDVKVDEFLEIMSFKDQDERRYLVTVYDNIFLEQNPEVIRIYSLP